MRRRRIQLRITKSHIDTLKFQMWVPFFKLCIIFTSINVLCQFPISVQMHLFGIVWIHKVQTFCVCSFGECKSLQGISEKSRMRWQDKNCMAMAWGHGRKCVRCFIRKYIYIYIVFRFTSKNHYSLFHPYRNHQVVDNFENVGCFYAIERMRVGETMLIGETIETVLRRNNAWVIKFC
jgi:hypothetical protein